MSTKPAHDDAEEEREEREYQQKRRKLAKLAVLPREKLMQLDDDTLDALYWEAVLFGDEAVYTDAVSDKIIAVDRARSDKMTAAKAKAKRTKTKKTYGKRYREAGYVDFR